MTKFNLNESLFTEEVPAVNQVPDDTFDYIFSGTDVDKVNPATLSMIKNPYKAWAKDPYTGQNKKHVMQQAAFILLRLYELTIVNPNNSYAKRGTPYRDLYDKNKVFDPAYGVKRSDLLQMSGAANPTTPGEGSTYFGDFKYIGLAYINPAGDMPEYVFPGARLEAYIKGALDSSYGAETFNRDTKQMEPFTNDVSMEADVGQLADRPRKTPSASKTRNPGTQANPFANIPGIKVVPQKPATPKVSDDDPFAGFKSEPETPVAKEEPVKEPIQKSEETPETFSNFDLKQFKKRKKVVGENMTEDLELVDDAYLIKDEADFMDRVKAAYRDWRCLTDDADLTNEYNPYDFKALCCCNKWPVEIRTKIWPGRDFT